MTRITVKNNLQRTRNILVFGVYPAGFVLLIWLSARIHPLLGLLVFPFAFGVALAMKRMRCPRCSAPIGWHTLRFLGHELEWWSPLAPKNCQRCGHDLTGKDAGGDNGR